MTYQHLGPSQLKRKQERKKVDIDIPGPSVEGCLFIAPKSRFSGLTGGPVRGLIIHLAHLNCSHGGRPPSRELSRGMS